jgi:hypothetical protein
MKKSTSATKSQLSKSTKISAKKAIKKAPVKGPGRGGARLGAGRKATKGDTVQWHIDIPIEIDNAVRLANVENKTTLIISLLKDHFKMKN